MGTYSESRALREHIFRLLRSISEETHEDPYSSHLLMTVGDVDLILDKGVSRITLSPEKVYRRMGLDTELGDLPDLNVYDGGSRELLLVGINKKYGSGDIDGTLVIRRDGWIVPGSFLIKVDTDDPDMVAEEGAGKTAMRYVSKLVPGASGFMMSEFGPVREFRHGKIYNEVGYEHGKQVILRKRGGKIDVFPVAISTPIKPGDQVVPVAAVAAI